MTIRQILTGIVSDAFEACGYDRNYGSVTNSNRPDLCQYQCNGSMSAAKIYKKSPISICNEIVCVLRTNKIFANIDAAAPGFININITDETITNFLNGMLSDPRLMLPLMEKQTIVIDFGGPNVAKPLHVGHLRSAIIGDCLCRLARFLGHDVIGDVHLGDWGLQMGLVIAEIKRTQPDLVYFNEGHTGEYPQEPPVTMDDLNILYPAASARAKVDKIFANEAAQATVDLQNLRAGHMALWKHLRSVSDAALLKSYKALGVSFDKWLGESDSDKYIPQIIEILTGRGLLHESQGAMVVDVELPDDKEPMPPILIVKSNGGDIYGTTDLATIFQRKQDWDPDEIWYVVDNRQALHLKQVFRCASLAGILQNTKCCHIGFGTMNGKDGKPYKTRDGDVMRLSDMIEIVTTNAYKRAAESDVITDENDKLQTAGIVGIAAMKIGDLVNHRTKDYIFDIDRFLASEGKTGPYLQYTAVRAKSIITKALSANEQFCEILPPASDTERDLMLSLTSISDVLLRAYDEKAPNIICEALFVIAGLFNRFYFENRILACEDNSRRGSWLSLIDLSYRAIKQLLDLVGIDVPDRM